MIGGRLDQRLVIEQPVVTRDAAFGAELIGWVALCQAWGDVVDIVNKRRGGEETVEENVRMRSGLTQITIRFRDDVTTAMRVRWEARNRTFQIVGIAEIDRRRGLQLSCEEFSLPIGAALAARISVPLLAA